MKQIQEYTDDMHSLQVVMSIGTDYQYRMRCLPGFLNKRYLNRHVFAGRDNAIMDLNEIYLGHDKIILSTDGNPNLREQLYHLFETQGIDTTFSYLSNEATERSDYYTQFHGVLGSNWSSLGLNMVAQQAIDDLIEEFSWQPSRLTLLETVNAMTYRLLQHQQGFYKKG